MAVFTPILNLIRLVFISVALRCWLQGCPSLASGSRRADRCRPRISPIPCRGPCHR
jgi:hypothetical protein